MPYLELVQWSSIHIVDCPPRVSPCAFSALLNHFQPPLPRFLPTQLLGFRHEADIETIIWTVLITCNGTTMGTPVLSPPHRLPLMRNICRMELRLLWNHAIFTAERWGACLRLLPFRFCQSSCHQIDVQWMSIDGAVNAVYYDWERKLCALSPSKTGFGIPKKSLRWLVIYPYSIFWWSHISCLFQLISTAPYIQAPLQIW